MNSYLFCLVASLVFYIAGILMIVNGSRSTGTVFIALGSTYFAIALSRRKRNK